MFKQYDRFDLALALYHWLYHNWSNTCTLYLDFCTLAAPNMYKPSHSEEHFDNIGDIAREIYSMLTEDNYKEALDLVINYKHCDICNTLTNNYSIELDDYESKVCVCNDPLCLKKFHNKI